MKVMLLPSAIGAADQDQDQFLTSYLINDTLAVDAGGLGFYRTPQEQARIEHVLLSHTHVDHIASLPILVENAYEGKRSCVTIHGSTAVLESLQRDIFNDRVWPDFIALSKTKAPFLKLETLETGKTITLQGLRITPVAVNHVVPTHGFIIEEETAALVIVSDTGPTEEIWQHANRTSNLKVVFLEACFPNAMTELAQVSKHLTPAMFAQEARKLHREAKLVAVHIKARFRSQVVSELLALGLANLEIGRMGAAYVL